jgi:hypothetical protein
MNEEAQKIFDAIVKKNPRDLSEDEVNFIHARRPYLNDEQMKVFGGVIAKREEQIRIEKNLETDGIILDKTPPLYISKKDRLKHASNK